MLARLVLAAVAAAILALPSPASAAPPAKPAKGPSGARFYEPPKTLPKGHGKLIWQRRNRGLTAIEGAASNRLVLYTSKTTQGKTTAVSGSVSVPPGKPPKGGWPVISWGHGTTGAADSCAPTRALATAPVAAYVSYIDPILESFVESGYAVVRSDYEGLGTPGPHPYLASIPEGRSVVDIVSAARRLVPGLSKRYVLAGHSQGGHAVLGGAGLAKRWAPDLRLRGTVAYAPASHLREQTQALGVFTSPSPLSAFAALILEGAISQDPQLKPELLLNPPPLALFPQVDETCLFELSQSDSLGGIAPAELLGDDADTTRLLDYLSTQNPAVRTSAPILMLQGTADTIVLPLFTGLLDEELVALGDKVTYTEYPGVGHAEIPFSAADEALSFIERRMPAR